MRANLKFLTTKFDEYNALCFDGVLPPLLLRISDSGRSLGVFRHPRLRNASSSRKCSISLSSSYDLPQSVVEDTIIHEMIHYFIWWKRLPDSSPHGPTFRKIMNEINSRHGRNISISHHSTANQLDSDTRHKNHYICMLTFGDGSRRVSFPARTRIFELHRIFSSHPDIVRLNWFWSSDPFFNRYSTCITPRAYAFNDKIESRLKEATPCICDGTIFKPTS